jgi:hypothetical protein
MTDTNNDIALGLDAQGQPTIVMPGQAPMTTIEEALAQAAHLTEPQHALMLARVLNHLSKGGQFLLIEDPARFEQDFRAQLAKEDAQAPWQPGVLRLCDHGTPDFKDISAPAHAGGGLVFFAKDRSLGLPYKATAKALSGPVDYTPLRLTPLPKLAQPSPKPGMDGFPRDGGLIKRDESPLDDSTTE